MALFPSRFYGSGNQDVLSAIRTLQQQVLSAIATLQQKVITMSTTIQQEVQADTAAVLAAAQTIANDVLALKAMLPAAGTVVTPADAAALHAAVDSMLGGSVASLNTLAAPPPPPPATP
jgi:pyridoxal biosynthesis lyase PdxS